MVLFYKINRGCYYVIALALCLLASNSAIPIQFVAADTATLERYKTIPIVDAKMLDTENYTSLGSVKVDKYYRTSFDKIEQIKLKAASMGADALSPIMCKADKGLIEVDISVEVIISTPFCESHAYKNIYIDETHVSE